MGNRLHKSLSQSVQPLIALFLHVWTHQRWAVLGSLLVGLSGAALAGGQVWLQKLVVDELAALAESGRLAWFLVLVAAQAGLGMGLGLVRTLKGRLGTLIRADTTRHLQMLAGQQAVRLPLQLYENSSIYDSSQQARLATQECPWLIDNVIDALNAVLELLAVLAILFAVHWTLPLALVASSVPGTLLLLFTKDRGFVVREEQLQQRREADYLYRILFDRQVLKEIRLFGIGGYLLDRWSAHYQSLRTLQLSLSARETGAGLAGQFLLAVTATGVSGWLAWRISVGTLTVGDYVAMAGAVFSVQGMLAQLGSTLGQIYERLLQLNRLNEYLTISASEPVTGKVAFPATLHRGIRVHDLVFQYPGAAEPVLKGVSFEVRQGERVAIVGANGAGKSTLSLCLLGLFAPSGGQIFYDDIDLRQIEEESLRRNVTAVFQDFVKFRLTLAENIGLGNGPEIPTDEELGEVAARVGIESFVRSLPHGWRTVLSKELEMGRELSGGQWQRIAIARAFVRDVQVLVLDEPTSALDPLAEREIYHRFSALADGKTSLMITHRLGSARFADRIVVLRDGRVVETGTHEQLMLADGDYRRLYLAQAHWYQDDKEMGRPVSPAAVTTSGD
jgi:ATP-binding cassette, subfamily B, bacterial